MSNSIDLDLELASRCVAGSAVAQRALFETYRPRVSRTLFHILGPSCPIDDLTQDAFIAVYRSLASYRGEGPLGLYIDRCVVRTAFAFLARRRSRPRELDLDAVPEPSDAEASAEDRALAREAGARVFAELERMDERTRVAFTQHAIDGRPLAEIAKAIGATVVTVKARVFRARRELEKRARRDPAIRAFLSKDARAPRLRAAG